jgi:predicted permease
LLGGSAGLLLASVVLKVVVRLAPDGIPRLDQAGLDGRVLAFTVAVSLATGLLFGLAPALTACRQGLNEALKGGGSSAVTVSGGRLRGGLVVAELALSLMLLAGATLLVRSLWRLESVPLGFQPAHVLTTQIMLNRYPDGQHRMAFVEGLLERVASIPGAEAVAITTALPPEGKSADLPFTRDGDSMPESSDQAGNVIARGISPEYFRAMAIPLRRGRFFDNRDKQDALTVCIVNDALVRRHFANEDTIGKRIMGRAGHHWLTIIGVVADAKNSGLRSQAEPELYWPHGQLDLPLSLNLLVRTKIRPENLVPLVRGEIRELNRDIPITFRTMDDELASLTLQPRFNAVLLGIFSGIALLLASVGIYGVLSYSVTQRTREIGIRMALGAAQRDVIRIVAGHALRLAGAGIAIGLILAFVMTRYLSSLLFEVRPTDPLTLGIAQKQLHSCGLIV